ncbi:FHA domain-containing protein [Paenibacillus sp.]|uniref:FHA domain-containing protein n=1 Tax=Paenibacillus sp. TaxID=58172 RepID=UPI00281E62D4|nr:FHA domain-containing protein [Paenibacillus sp.]MDR0267392.1 FHA domain-containing protein [Paenibacillus sp.]
MKTEKSRSIAMMDLLIYGILIGTVIYALLRPFHYILQMSIVAAAAAMACALIWTGDRKPGYKNRKGKTPIAKIVLLDDDGERVKEWFVKGEIAVLIGKSTSQGEVDIDLSDCEYASLISPEHAVLNRVGDDWFIEDADSHSGTGIRKSGRSDANRLVVEEPQRLGAGDMIFIANTRLLVK